MNRIEALCLVFGDNCDLATGDAVAMIGDSIELSNDELDKLPENVFRKIKSFQNDPQQFIDSFEEAGYRVLLQSLVNQTSKIEQTESDLNNDTRDPRDDAGENESEEVYSKEINEIALFVAMFRMGIIKCAKSLNHADVISHPRWKLLLPLVLKEVEEFQSPDVNIQAHGKHKLEARKEQLKTYASAICSEKELQLVGKFMLLMLLMLTNSEASEEEKYFTLDPKSMIFRFLFVDSTVEISKNELGF